MAQAQTRTATFAPLAAAPGRPGRRKRVTWIPGQVARSEEEKILLDALTEQGLQSLNDVKTYLADTLYWRDFLRGGWAADIALLRHLYAREAQDIIGKLQGVTLLVEED